MQNIQIIILAGGKGKRMKSEEPKALILFKGKPLIKHILNTVNSLNLETKPIIVVGYKKERVEETLGSTQKYAEQKEQLGTGHAVMSARNMAEKNNGLTLIIATDQPTVSKETLEKIISTHKEKNATVTLGTVIVPDFNDWRVGMYQNFGRIIRENDGSVKEIIEFKDASEEQKNIKELNPALYAFDSKWLWENIDKLKNENVQGEYYLTDIVKMAFNQNKKIEAVQVSNIIEGLQPNSKEELEILEKLSV